MASDWEADSAEEAPTKAPTAIPRKKKWEGEDEDDSSAPEDWEVTSDSESEEKPLASSVAPPRKKGTLKAKIAEREAAKAQQREEANEELEDVAVLDPLQKKRLDKEKELKSDLSNAADLLGTAAPSSSSNDLEYLLTFNPRTKDDFQQLSSRIIDIVISRHQAKPLYPSFVEHHVKALALPLKDVEVRKAASVLTTFANEKQKEQREKAGGKKKSKTTTKPTLGSSKVSNKLDTNVYDESLDDFGTNADDFM